MIEGVDDSYQRMRAAAARRERARRLRREAERASTAWPAFAPQVALGSGALGEAQAADREIGRLYALRARKLAQFAAARPASADRAQGEAGAMSPERWERRPQLLRPVSEWATPEASIALTRSQPKTEAMLVEALTLTGKLPGTLAALEAGMLTPEHLRPLLEHVAIIGDDQLRAEIEAEVLRWVAARAGKRTLTTPPQLRDAVLRVVTRREARDRAQRAITALRERGVFRLPEDREGLGALGIVATEAEIATLQAALEAYADALDDPADGRTHGEQMIGCLLDLVLRPGESGLPPVQVVLTLVAAVQTTLGGDAPAQLNGRVVSAETARQLLNALTGAGLGEGVLAELRRIAGADEADTDEADTDEADEFPVPDPFTPEEQALIELSAWFDELPWRLAAGEPHPGEPPEELLAAWPGDPDELFEEGFPDDEEEPDEDEPGEDVEVQDLTAAPPPAGGWWADADRAVADARAAQREAEAALWRAERRVRTAERADRADARGWHGTAAARVDRAAGALEALAAATDADRETLLDLLERTAGGGLAERPRIALVDAVSGALVSLSDLPGLRRAAHDGTALGAPPPTDGYRPGAALDRFIRTRDPRCRFPGCRRRVCRGEIDHRIAWPEGPTDVTNLAGFCTGDHRGKHQAPGFRYEAEPDASLVVTTPSGITAVTEPPPF
jgi:hypothetical protein